MRRRTAGIALVRERDRKLLRMMLALSGGIVAFMLAVANAGPAGTGSWHAQPWDPTATIITSEFEYHEPTNQPKNQQFGQQVALSGDGRTLAVSDIWYFGGSEWPWYGSGAVYVYRWTNGTWTLEAKLQPPQARGYDSFGSDLALNLSGDTLAVGAEFEGYDAPSQAAGPGTVFVYKRRTGAWAQEAALRASRPQDGASFGRTVDISALGNVIAVGAPYESIEIDGETQRAAGAVYVFTKRTGVWTEQAVSAPQPQSNDLFGWGVRLSEYGGTLAILAAEQNFATEDAENGGWPNRNNTVYVFQRQLGGWSLAAEFEGLASAPHFAGTMYSDGQTEGFDLSGDGRSLAIASPFGTAADGRAGLVQIYRRRGTQWTSANATLTPTFPERRSFGLRLTLSADGRTLVAFADRDDGAYGHPYVVAFEHSHGRWKQTAIFDTPVFPLATGFANSLALSWSGSRLAVGARTFSTENSYWGAALLYVRQVPQPR